MTTRGIWFVKTYSPHRHEVINVETKQVQDTYKYRSVADKEAARLNLLEKTEKRFG